jgi:hypothetical protein
MKTSENITKVIPSISFSIYVPLLLSLSTFTKLISVSLIIFILQIHLKLNLFFELLAHSVLLQYPIAYDPTIHLSTCSDHLVLCNIINIGNLKQSPRNSPPSSREIEMK